MLDRLVRSMATHGIAMCCAVVHRTYAASTYSVHGSKHLECFPIKPHRVGGPFPKMVWQSTGISSMWRVPIEH